MLLLFEAIFPKNSSLPQVEARVLWLCVAAAYQVLVGEPCDLVLQTGFDSSFRRQLKVLGQELLLTVVVLLHALQLAAQRLHLHVVRSLLRLQLVLQQPGVEQVEEMKKGRTTRNGREGKRAA